MKNYIIYNLWLTRLCWVIFSIPVHSHGLFKIQPPSVFLSKFISVERPRCWVLSLTIYIVKVKILRAYL